MSPNQSLNSGRPVQQQGFHPDLAPRVDDHVAQSSNGLNNNNRGQQQQQKQSASIPGSTTTTYNQHRLHLSETLMKTIAGVRPIAPAGMPLSSATEASSSTAKTPSSMSLPPSIMGPPLILSSLAQQHTGGIQQHSQQQQQQAPMLINSRHTPTIFQNTKFRAGKWIPEEETYAELLIALFETGRIIGCEKGTTLRSYLSQKLHCAPMRISKKYAGKGIGKMVYLSKMKPVGQEAGGNDDDDEEKQYKALVQRVKAAEEKFYQAVFPLHDPFLGGGSSFLTNKSSFPLFNGMLPMFSPTQSLPFAMPPNFMNHTFPSAGGGVAFNNNTLPTTTLQQLKDQVKQQQQQSQPLQQKLPPIAAKPEQPSLTVPMFPAQGIKVTDDDLRQSFLKALHESDKTEKDPQDSKPPPPPQPAHVIENKNGRIASKGGITLQKHHHHHNHRQHHNNHHHHHHHHHHTTLDHSSVKTTAKELPDFLSGFDRAGKSSRNSAPIKHHAVPNTNNEEAYSPTYTTQSFDDLHCLLGKGLPPSFEQNFAAKSSAAAGPNLQPRAHPPPLPEPVTQTTDSGTSHALFTAESYAMFAQESARAASEHDAYLTGMGIHVQQPRGESLDIEGMVNLVSEHVSTNQKPVERQGESIPTIVPLSTSTTAERNRTSITWNKRAKEESPPPPTTTGMSFPAGPTYMSVVSASEPGTETESNMSSFRESTSGSDNTDNNSTSEGNTDSNSSEGSDSEDSRKRKQALGGSEQRCNKKSRQIQEGRQLETGATEAFLSRPASS